MLNFPRVVFLLSQSSSTTNFETPSSIPHLRLIPKKNLYILLIHRKTIALILLRLQIEIYLKYYVNRHEKLKFISPKNPLGCAGGLDRIWVQPIFPRCSWQQQIWKPIQILIEDFHFSYQYLLKIHYHLGNTPENPASISSNVLLNFALWFTNSHSSFLVNPNNVLTLLDVDE